MTKPIRPTQNNRRMKGRNSRRSTSSNPMSRNYDSNGPDIKIRGNASHIADKYTQLARDANSSGDPIKAENYLQHAEHYSRLILAFQANREENANNNRNRRHTGHQHAGSEDAHERDGSGPSGNNNRQRKNGLRRRRPTARNQNNPANENNNNNLEIIAEDDSNNKESRKPERNSKPRRRVSRQKNDKQGSGSDQTEIQA